MDITDYGPAYDKDGEFLDGSRVIDEDDLKELLEKADRLENMIDDNIRATKAIDFAEAKLIEAKSFMR